MDKLAEESFIEKFAGKGTFVVDKSKKIESEFSGNVIGLVMSGFSSNFGKKFIEGVSNTANKLGYSLITALCYQSAKEEKELIDRMIANGAKGAVIMPIHDENLINVGIVESVLSKFPIVLADRYLDCMRLPFVGTDNIESSFNATKYLFSLGHKNIGFVSPVPSTTTIKEREEGFFKAYAMTNYQFKMSSIFNSIESGMPGKNNIDYFNKDVENIKKFLTDNKDTTALLCADSITRDVCVKAAKDLKIRIPEDLSLVSFDSNIELGDENPYTYIKQDEYKMGEIAVEMLIDLIKDIDDVKNVLLPAKLVIGSSTKSIKK